MRKLIAAAGVAATVLTTLAVPTFADAHRRNYRHYHNTSSRYSNCQATRRSDGNKGTLAGAGVGALSGALIGGDALGAVVGAGVGAVAGHQIAKSRVRC